MIFLFNNPFKFRLEKKRLMDLSNLTPAMRQYFELKENYKDCIIMFRMGDFYEMFYQDAEIASKELEITLTSRGKGERRAPLAGMPYHALEPYLKKLVKKGYKVAICEQLEDPKLAKGLVKRGVVRVVTPGTLLEDDTKNNSYIMSLLVHGDSYFVAVCDLSTGEFYTTNETDIAHAEECVIPSSLLVNQELITELKSKGYYISEVEDRYFSQDYANRILMQHFGVVSLEGFGLTIEDKKARAAGALLAYLRDTQMQSLTHIKTLYVQSDVSYMVLDSTAVRNLELFKNVRDNSAKGSLLSVVDRTLTSMGSRTLKKWMARPLLNVEEINDRLKKVEFLCENLIVREKLRLTLKKVGDMERLIAKINFGSANPRDLLSLKSSLEAAQEISIEEFGELGVCSGFDEIINIVHYAIREDATANAKSGGVISLDYDPDLKNLHSIRKNSKQYLSSLEKDEREKTRIANLRIGYNKVFGYYFEVSKGNLNKVPNYFIRKQTLTNYERYITEDLKNEEEKILTAQEKIGQLEVEIYEGVVKQLKGFTLIIQNLAKKIGILDVISAFAHVAIENNYVKPRVDESDKMEVINGRHPVVELVCDYVPNKVLFDGFEIMIITGPNFSGKSCYMKQVALISIMAQMGSYVPAESAKIGVVDRIFTRIGAYDDLIAGQSTFMVEMSEAANILNNATNKSLILLDEVGRGTSTYDGVAIAWSVIEYIYNRIKAKTMFATHYHVLNKLENSFENIRNYNIAVKEDGESIIFLRTLLQGGTDKSFGVHVAQLAGLPEEVINRAKVVQKKLEMADKTDRLEMKRLDNQKKLF
jgi:DNA mismatch repair protein MutS